MAVYTTIKRTDVFPYSNENATGSFYNWAKSLFDHALGYTVVFDKELTSPEDRQEIPMPCILINQIDTTDPSKGFMGGERDENSVLYYIYCMVNKMDTDFGTPRLVRRMKDQFIYALKHAGIYSDASHDILIPPIQMYDYSKTPEVALNSHLSINSSIMQHLIEETEILKYELMVSFKYIEETT